MMIIMKIIIDDESIDSPHSLMISVNKPFHDIKNACFNSLLSN